MKKLLFLITAVAFMFTACEKDNQQSEAVQNATQDGATIEFKIDQTDFGYKNTVPMCDDELDMSYVKFTVLDSAQMTTSYKSMIYFIGGEMLTQVIKLPVGTYQVTSFVVYNDNGTPDDENDDVIVRAAPLPGSEYWDLMQYKLNLEFTVDAFYKKQYEIDVLCFEELFYNEFGFTWFEFNDVRIEYQCVFGDICVDDYDLYLESLYENQVNGIQFDMPAIFEIKVFKGDDEEALRTFSNAEWYGEGQCLEVYWPNRLDVEGEVFHFELWVWLPAPDGFEYILVDTWTFMDGEGAMTGEDGVVDFVIGDCHLYPADYEYDLSYNCYPDLPSPELLFEYSEEWLNQDLDLYIRYYFDVTNYFEFPDELFVPSPDLPPCGLNDNSSRTWVDIYDQDGNRIYGFCGLELASDLNIISCAVPIENPQPYGFYIELEDRRCDIIYTSEIIYLP